MAIMWRINQPMRRKRKGSGNCIASHLLVSYATHLCKVHRKTRRERLVPGPPRRRVLCAAGGEGEGYPQAQPQPSDATSTCYRTSSLPLELW